MDEVIYKSPLGPLSVTATSKGLSGINFLKDDDDKVALNASGHAASNPHISSAIDELNLYFDRKLESFNTPLDPIGTDFQKSVWNALSQIPFGVTASYGDIAHQIGNPNSSRAVGLANNRNPISIIVPCHRVIGANGKLVGYGGGISKKEWLLRHEGILL